MGRLFWKFFFFIWLIQLAGVFATGAFFWLERQEMAARFGPPPGDAPRPPPAHFHPPPDFLSPGPERAFPPPPPPGAHGRPPPPPYMHMLVGLFASLLSAAGLAWYIANPIRRLRQAFESVAGGDLRTRIGDGMGRRQDELADLGRSFDRMAERLNALMEGQQRLLHDVSHELRSPLARMHAAIGLSRQQPARLEDSLQRIEREGERMNCLVGELLTLSRLEAGVAGAQEEIDLADLLDGVVEDARFEGAARHVAVDAAQLPDWLVFAHGPLLQRAFENVLRNALRFSPEGGRVCIEAHEIAPGRCCIAILDAGPGVPEEDLADIFTPFFRGRGAGDGYGLGLAIAKRVLLAVDGEIRAKNRPEGGLRVELELRIGA